MGQVLLTNNAYTTLAAGCASTDTTLTVVSSSTFPAPTTASTNWFYACLQDTYANMEIVKVTNVSGTAWTVTRGVGGTTARAFVAGSVAELRVTAETLSDVSVQNSAVYTVELYTATAGQTAFPTVTTYFPAINTLDVFVNGLQVNLGTDYVETSGNLVTFNAGLTLGDEVKFKLWRTGLVAAATDAAMVAYTPTSGGTTTVQSQLRAITAPTGSSLVGFQQSGTGAVARTLQDKARESVSVLDFGAKGDGVTVDTDAFIRAISTSLNIYIPAGTYLIGPTVLSGTGQMLYLGINTGNASRSGMTILGAGQGNTTLKLQNGAGSNALMFGLGLSDVLSDATFSDFAIDLNGANNDTNTIYNNAFYFYGKCTNILWERITVKNMATHQPIRVGNETLAGFGNGITIRNCTFDTFGLAGGYTTTDISVLYIQADNVKVLDNTFTNPSFTLNTGKGHTAIEVNGATSTIIRGNRFRYVQLCTLIDSFYQDHTNIEIQGNTYSQCNFLVACDTVGSTFAQSRISVKGNTWGSTWNNASSVIQLGATGESAKTREYITIEGNIIYGWGNFNQGNNIIYANSNYLRSLLIQNNDIGGYAGSLIYLLGTVQNSNYLDITIQNNRLDSLGQSSGGTCFIDIEPSSGTINALNITGNTFFNTSLNNYSTKGAIKLSGNINYINIQGNTGMNGVGSTYPMVVDSMVNGTWLSKVVDSSTVSGNSELPVDYRPNIVALAGNTSVNIYDFSTFTLNNFTMLEIDVWGSVGGSSNGSLVSYKVLVASSAKIATLITQGGTYGTNVTLNFSGNILRITSTTATALSCMFRIKGLTTTPIAWLI